MIQVVRLVAAAPRNTAGRPRGAHRLLHRASTGVADLPHTPVDATPEADLASLRQVALAACQSGG